MNTYTKAQAQQTLEDSLIMITEERDNIKLSFDNYKNALDINYDLFIKNIMDEEGFLWKNAQAAQQLAREIKEAANSIARETGAHVRAKAELENN